MSSVGFSFVDHDIFLRYTHLGVGHPVTLQRMARHYFGLDLTPAEAMDIDEGEITMTGQQMDVDLGEESEGEYDKEDKDDKASDIR